MKLRLPILLAAFALLLVFTGLVAFILSTNAKTSLEIYASHELGRKVTIGSMRIAWAPLAFELDDVHVANAPWGSGPDMLRVRHVAAQVNAASLFSGHPEFTSLFIESAALLLERDAQGVGSWKKLGERQGEHPWQTEAGRSRRHFPTLLDASLKDSSVILMTSSGGKLAIDFKNVRIKTPDANRPVTLEVDGAYNSIPVHMDIATDSFAALHDTAAPFGVDILAEGATAKVKAVLKMMDPLNFDRSQGNVRIAIKRVGTAAALLGAGFKWDVPLEVESGFKREGDRWSFARAAGRLAGGEFADSRIQLNEGGRGEPDAVEAAVHFASLNLTALNGLSAGGAKEGETPLAASDNPPLLLDADMTAGKLSYGKIAATDMKLHAGMKRGAYWLAPVSMQLFGSLFSASLAAKAVGKTTALSVKAELPGADAGRLLSELDIGSPFLAGKLRASLLAGADGATLEEWLRTMRGHVRLAMNSGRVSRELIRVASTDMRMLLGPDHAFIPAPCLRAEATFTRGTGVLSPFRLETAQGTLLGAGLFNLPQGTLDLMFQTDAKTTSRLALDVPIHVKGKIGSPHILPSKASHAPVDFTESRNARCRVQP